MHTVVVLPDGSIDAELSSLAASRYSENDSIPPQAERALDLLNRMDVEEAFRCAKRHVEQNAKLWDWDEDVELIGVARVVALPASLTFQINRTIVPTTLIVATLLGLRSKFLSKSALRSPCASLADLLHMIARQTSARALLALSLTTPAHSTPASRRIPSPNVV